MDGLFTGTGYRLPVPPAPAFCLGNVIMTRGEAIDPGSRLFRHEARHATQFAWCGGVVMIPLYLAAAGVSWVLTGDFGARNVFERRAGLADGGYTDKPLRPALRRARAAGQRARAGRAGAHAAAGLPRTGPQPHVTDRPPALPGEQELPVGGQLGDPVHDGLRVPYVPLPGPAGVDDIGDLAAVRVDPGQVMRAGHVGPDEARRPGQVVQALDPAALAPDVQHGLRAQ